MANTTYPAMIPVTIPFMIPVIKFLVIIRQATTQRQALTHSILRLILLQTIRDSPLANAYQRQPMMVWLPQDLHPSTWAGWSASAGTT